MANNDAPDDGAPNNRRGDLILYETEEDYPMPYPMVLRSIPYVETEVSLGIKLYNGPPWETVWASQANNGFRFNEEHNSYGKSITARAMTTVTLNGRIQFKVKTVDVVPNRTIAVLFG